MKQQQAKTILSLDGVEVSFLLGKKLFSKGRLLHAINNISLDIKPGEFLSIVGESGCGKSTLAKTILGLQPPTAGRIFLNGKEISTYSRKQIAHQVQPIFQDPYSSLNPRKSVAANIALPLIVSESLSKHEVRDQVHEIMDLVGLPRRFENTYPGQMSGGQRQRVAIARALITRPKVLICDEPTSALDVSVQAQILNLLRDLTQKLNLTTLFISHDLSVVRHLSQRVAVMYLGNVVELGDAEQIFSQPKHPYTQLLISSILPPDPKHTISSGAAKGGPGPDPLNPPTGCHFHPRCPVASPQCKVDQPKLVENFGVEVACLIYQTNDHPKREGGVVPQRISKEENLHG